MKLTLCLGLALASAANAAAQSNTPSFNQLKSAAATGDMSTVTGETTPQTPGSVPQAQPPAPYVPSAQPPAPSSPAAAPSLTVQQPASSGSFMTKFMAKAKDFLHSLPVNQMLAGAAFGAAIGGLLGLGSPVGWIGGALIGGFLGAVIGTGIVGKLLHHGGTGGS